jgi:hypothetical protein
VAQTPAFNVLSMHIHRSLVTGGAALLCVGLTACSAASSPPAAAPSPAQPPATSASASAAPQGKAGLGPGKPCALLTQSDVTSAIGEAVTTGTTSGDAVTKVCVYQSTSGSIAGGLLVVSSWRKLLSGVRTAKLTQTPVQGIGDEASKVFSQTGQGYPALVVRKGDIGFEVSIHGPKILSLPDRGFAKEEALAALILARL